MDVEGLGGGETEETGGDDLRSAIEGAFDSAEASAPETPVEPAEASGDESGQEETQEVQESRQRDDKGRFAGKEKDAATPAQDASKTKPIKAESGTTPRLVPNELAKAPQSWKPMAREKWAALPPEVQQEVSRVDREVRQTMQESADSRRFHQQFQQTVTPYLGMLRSEGAEPLAAVDSLMRTAYALRTAPPATKAQILAHLVKSYAVPIDALDEALVGQQPQQGQQQQFDPNQLQQQITDGVIQRLQAQRSQALEQRGAQDIQEFESQAEFIDDVRDDMADLLDLASKRRQELTLQQAYDKAVMFHPELSQVIQQREEAKRAVNAKASTQRARTAASSVRSQPSGLAYTKEPASLRDFIESAWDSSGE